MNLPRITIIILISLGAALGANARYWLGQLVTVRMGSSFPYGTLIINCLGSLGIGLFLGLPGTTSEPGLAWRVLIATGFLGGFTTFSTFSYEAVWLISQNRWFEAWIYIGSSVVLGLMATACGIWLVQQIAR
jgi:fluoride exporter